MNTQIDKLTIALYHLALTNGKFVGTLKEFNAKRIELVGVNPSQVKRTNNPNNWV